MRSVYAAPLRRLIRRIWLDRSAALAVISPQGCLSGFGCACLLQTEPRARMLGSGGFAETSRSSTLSVRQCAEIVRSRACVDRYADLRRMSTHNSDPAVTNQSQTQHTAQASMSISAHLFLSKQFLQPPRCGLLLRYESRVHGLKCGLHCGQTLHLRVCRRMRLQINCARPPCLR